MKQNNAPTKRPRCGFTISQISAVSDETVATSAVRVEPPCCGRHKTIQCMDKILHHVETMGSHSLLVFTSEAIIPGLSLVIHSMVPFYSFFETFGGHGYPPGETGFEQLRPVSHLRANVELNSPQVFGDQLEHKGETGARKESRDRLRSASLTLPRKPWPRNPPNEFKCERQARHPNTTHIVRACGHFFKWHLTRIKQPVTSFNVDPGLINPSHYSGGVPSKSGLNPTTKKGFTPL